MQQLKSLTLEFSSLTSPRNDSLYYLCKDLTSVTPWQRFPWLDSVQSWAAGKAGKLLESRNGKNPTPLWAGWCSWILLVGRSKGRGDEVPAWSWIPSECFPDHSGGSFCNSLCSRENITHGLGESRSSGQAWHYEHPQEMQAEQFVWQVCHGFPCLLNPR